MLNSCQRFVKEWKKPAGGASVDKTRHGARWNSRRGGKGLKGQHTAAELHYLPMEMTYLGSGIWSYTYREKTSNFRWFPPTLESCVETRWSLYFHILVLFVVVTCLWDRDKLSQECLRRYRHLSSTLYSTLSLEQTCWSSALTKGMLYL